MTLTWAMTLNSIFLYLKFDVTSVILKQSSMRILHAVFTALPSHPLLQTYTYVPLSYGWLMLKRWNTVTAVL